MRELVVLLGMVLGCAIGVNLWELPLDAGVPRRYQATLTDATRAVAEGFVTLRLTLDETRELGYDTRAFLGEKRSAWYEHIRVVIVRIDPRVVEIRVSAALISVQGEIERQVSDPETYWSAEVFKTLDAVLQPVGLENERSG